MRISCANSAYTSHELAFQYQNSGSHVIFTTDEGLAVVREMFKQIGVKNGDQRTVILGKSLKWAGGPDAPKAADGLLHLDDLLSQGSLDKEEMFDGNAAHETVLLCYSSVRNRLFIDPCNSHLS